MSFLVHSTKYFLVRSLMNQTPICPLHFIKWRAGRGLVHKTNLHTVQTLLITPYLNAPTHSADTAVGHVGALIVATDRTSIVRPLCETVNMEGVVAKDG